MTSHPSADVDPTLDFSAKVSHFAAQARVTDVGDLRDMVEHKRVVLTVPAQRSATASHCLNAPGAVRGRSIDVEQAERHGRVTDLQRLV